MDKLPAIPPVPFIEPDFARQFLPLKDSDREFTLFLDVALQDYNLPTYILKLCKQLKEETYCNVGYLVQHLTDKELSDIISLGEKIYDGTITEQETRLLILLGFIFKRSEGLCFTVDNPQRDMKNAALIIAIESMQRKGHAEFYRKNASMEYVGKVAAKILPRK